MEALRAEAAAQGLSLVTTEKDYVKLPDSAKKDISCLKVRAEWAPVPVRGMRNGHQ